MDFGNRIRHCLEALDITQKELAKRLALAPSTLNGYVTGHRQPDRETIIKLALVLEVSIDYLLTGKEQQKKPPAEAEGKKEKILAILDNLTDEGVEKVLGMTLLMFPEDTEDVSK